MKYFQLFVIIIMVLRFDIYSKTTPDTLSVQTFTFDDIEKRRGIFLFPESEDTYQKIIMVRTLKCDKRTTRDEYPCGEWDYSTNTVVYTHENSIEEKFELEGFVTPYGKGLDLNGDCGFSWYYDVTDFAPLLKGKVDISSGNTQELLDMQFIFIKGTPPRDVLEIKNIYPLGHFKYQNLADDDTLKQVTIPLRKDAFGYKLRARISGHGHFGPRNCCEWDSKTHTYYTHGQVLYRWNVWKDCGHNPVFPQGGTWQFDRAGWCPGTPVDTYDFELTEKVMPGDTLLFDYGIEPYSDNGEKDGEYRMSHQMFTYGKPNFKNDAAIINIISPSKKEINSRVDVKYPQIEIQNTGSNTLYSLFLVYGIQSKTEKVFKWVGKLEFLKSELISLTDFDWSTIEPADKFYAKIIKANGSVDEYSANDQFVSDIEPLTALPEKFTLHIETNDKDRAKENAYTVTDQYGKIVFERTNLKDDTTYDDIIKLEKGMYTFRMTDRYQDGMIRHWWYYSSDKEKVGKNGRIAIMNTDKKVIKELKFDFADELNFNFIVK